MSRSVTCILCAGKLSVKFNVSEYIQHVRLFHAYKPDFKITCGINGCLRSYTNVGTFRNHVSAAHYSNDQLYADIIDRDDPNGIQCNENPDSSDDPDSSDEDLQSDNPNSDLVAENTFSDTNNITDAEDAVEACNVHSLHCSMELLQRSSALFLLGLKEKYKITQVAIQGVIQGVASITQQRISILKSQVCILYICIIMRLILFHNHQCF